MLTHFYNNKSDKIFSSLTGVGKHFALKNNFLGSKNHSNLGEIRSLGNSCCQHDFNFTKFPKALSVFS